MKLISLNTWGGRAMHPLMEFFRRYRDDTDIFCLQEMHDTTQEYREDRHPDEWVRWDLWEKTRHILPGFYGRFARFSDNPDRMSQAMFIKQHIARYESDTGDCEIYNPEKPVEHGSAVISPRMAQAQLVVEGRDLIVIANYHGLWTPDGKMDTPERIEQSRLINQFLDRWGGLPTVLCGDFNLDIDTKSLAILETGRRNLIKSYDIKSTRTVLYRDYDNPDETKFADYIFVSPQIKVNEFRVMSDICSDHTPLYLDFSVV